ncbi:hypothetical protein NLG97_g7630 [Lecanicillium saksenae]|uniref:Uncharacterized protein n=1 Tax=Lecanicillium saksenae TaxID=468837 RepID=A0ACC1QMZ0_9HYPO|nr:hypothetical protein NLG97_g7630 [Lecanicillium saksenae]
MMRAFPVILTALFTVTVAGSTAETEVEQLLYRRAPYCDDPKPAQGGCDTAKGNRDAPVAGVLLVAFTMEEQLPNVQEWVREHSYGGV